MYAYIARIRPRSVIVREDPWDGAQLLGGETVYEGDDKPVDTGLVNQNGTPLWRVSFMNRIGFDLTRKMR